MEPIFHFIIPVAVLLLLGIDRRIVLLLSPLSVIQDLDAFTHLHRALLHNVFFGALLIIFLAMALRYSGLPGWARQNKRVILLSAVFLFSSQLALDFDTAGIALFYPASDTAFAFDTEGIGITTRDIHSIQLSEAHLKENYMQPAWVVLAFLILGVYAYLCNRGSKA